MKIIKLFESEDLSFISGSNPRFDIHSTVILSLKNSLRCAFNIFSNDIILITYGIRWWEKNIREAYEVEWTSYRSFLRRTSMRGGDRIFIDGYISRAVWHHLFYKFAKFQENRTIWKDFTRQQHFEVCTTPMAPFCL